jgi:hypothetical protein
LVTGFCYVCTAADGWFRNAESAREAEVGRSISAFEAYEPWSFPIIGVCYRVTQLKQYGLPTNLIFRGWADTRNDPPLKGNQIGGFRRTRDSQHIWVWAEPQGSQTPAWIDP